MNAITPDQIHRQKRGEVSQATAVEQSRAVAEVQAAVTLAHAKPRDEIAATAKAMESCKQRAVAETAFFKFPRGGQSITGESVHLARELARCWGNINYGISELSRDDGAAMSEMVAYAWDLETNAQSRMTFQVPHKRDKRGGAEVLTDMRDIYENNANMGARRLRECIFAVLPPYLKEMAKQGCLDTLQKGEDGKPLQVRITEAVSAFEKIGISRERLEARKGKATSWTAMDVAQLVVSYRSINRNEVSADEEFPRVELQETVDAARRIVDQQRHAGGGDTGADTLTDENPAATEGRDDADMGEAHNSIDRETETFAGTARDERAKKLIRMAINAQTRTDIARVEALADDELIGVDKEDIAYVNAAIDAATKRISKGEN